ncbi:bifunctional 2-polyprenyl-6-hydroxyphenol methylase/3-demethylubiquinol 3-O-methyltransferase UbiG [Legionella sp. W05-934-2]|uniref:bifunctional 2-polyprenyl-6-hydroxyphenol methylase/3-demethylubiquinol 3-O-methyltransferase UbiG n=1 Tax=Legionella sp. W05-934-2 TaxID=1198649 RepID=UPI0034633C67
MMTPVSTVNQNEKSKFDAHQSHWWDKNGPLKTLHDINPTRLNFVQEHSDLADCNVLDVGCGGGVLCEAMAEHAKSVTGIDIVSSAIETAIDHANQAKLTIRYLNTPIEDLSESQFDVITCMEMLEHVDSPDIVIKHCYRLLKNQGWLLLSTINRTAIAYAQVILAAEYLLNVLPRQTHDFNKFIKPSELSRICREHGFEVIDIKGLKYNPFTRQSWLNDQPNVNYLLACRKCVQE